MHQRPMLDASQLYTALSKAQKRGDTGLMPKHRQVSFTPDIGCPARDKSLQQPAVSMQRLAAVGSQGNSSSSRGATKDDSAVQFEICRIPGDGSCLFRALAQGLHQLEAGEERLLPSA